MKKTLKIITLVMMVLFMSVSGSLATEITRTPWQMHEGEGIIPFGYMTPYHGYELSYDNFATIPPKDSIDWTSAPNGDTIDYNVPSTLCGVIDCRCGADFTYFQTFVNVPIDFIVDIFTIAFNGIDDGVRVTIFNSDYPNGEVVPGSYVFLYGSGTANLMSLIKPGERNRVIITHIDDCCYNSYLQRAQVKFNGESIPPSLEMEIPIDIKPMSCPNPLNVNNKGVLSVAIVGTKTFNVTEVDVASVRLEGIAPVRSAFEDVATPFEPFLDKNDCFVDCHEYGADGFNDLVLKFDVQKIVELLGDDVENDDCFALSLTGTLKEGGLPIVGEDLVIIKTHE